MYSNDENKDEIRNDGNSTHGEAERNVPGYSLQPETDYAELPDYSTPPETEATAPVYSAPPEAEYANAHAFGAPPPTEPFPAHAPPQLGGYSPPPAYNAQSGAAYQQPYPHYDNRQQASPWNMYSPGVYADRPAPRDRNLKSAAPKLQGVRKSHAGAFVRAACLVLACVLLSAGATFLVIDYRIERGDFAPTTNQVILGGPPPAESSPEIRLPATMADLSEGSISPQDIYDMALTQVVGISITPPESNRFFGTQGSVPSVVGSGFIISTDGYILTNHHVIEDAYNGNMPINAILSDGSSHGVEVVGFDAANDVALLKIAATGLNPAAIRMEDDLRVGQTVYAVGNPFGDFVYTMTDGIVSALDRIVSLDGKSIRTFQFSAAVNPGNSGGPVYNDRGQVIGIVTAKLTRGNIEGIGFAIPILDAIEIATALIDHGYIPNRPLLGVSVQTIDEAIAEYHGWVIGSRVVEVVPGSAAERAGIRVGDIITALNGEPIDSNGTLHLVLRQYHRAGDTATITVWRDGETIDLSITFDENLNAGRPS